MKNSYTRLSSILIFSISIMLSGNVFAADTTPRRVTQPEFDAAIATVNSKINDITPKVYAIGDYLSDESIVFWVDETGQRGLAAWPHDDADANWYDAILEAENHGPGWRLPTKYELNLLYQQRSVMGNFAGIVYLSSNSSPSGVWIMNFIDGDQGTTSSSQPWSVRAVRAF